MSITTNEFAEKWLLQSLQDALKSKIMAEAELVLAEAKEQLDKAVRDQMDAMALELFSSYSMYRRGVDLVITVRKP